jgi:hypothetical protein
LGIDSQPDVLILAVKEPEKCGFPPGAISTDEDSDAGAQAECWVFLVAIIVAIIIVAIIDVRTKQG